MIVFNVMQVIFQILRGEKLQEVIRQCDMGLLMGEPILDNVLSSLAEDVGTRIQSQNDGDFDRNQNSINFAIDEFKTILPNQSEKKFIIEYVDLPSLENFSRIMKASQPTVIRKAIEHWPAFRKWNIQYVVQVWNVFNN
jgi:lysine-specific demethylase 8